MNGGTQTRCHVASDRASVIRAEVEGSLAAGRDLFAFFGADREKLLPKHLSIVDFRWRKFSARSKIYKFQSLVSPLRDTRESEMAVKNLLH